MKITFIGATHEVTGSCYYLEAAGKKFLVDCGMEPVSYTHLIQDRVVLSYTDNRNGGLCSVCDICKNVFGNRSGKRLQSTIDTDGNRAGTEGNCAACSAVFGIFLSDYTAK